MSQHPSLKSKTKGAAHRSVLKRYERLRELKEKEKWNEGQSVFGLLKLKILKFKIKKEKPIEAEAAVAAEGAEAAVAAEGAAATKETAEKPKKEASKKEAAKPAAKGKEPKK